MYKMLKFLFFMWAIIATSPFVTSAQAQKSLTPAQEFSQWRASIPDYEKRLYDRVKSLNKRTVRLQRIIIIGFVVLFLFMVVLFIRHKKGTLLSAISPNRNEKRIFENQKALMNILSDIEASNYLKKSEIDNFSALIESCKMQMLKIQENIDLQEQNRTEEKE